MSDDVTTAAGVQEIPGDTDGSTQAQHDLLKHHLLFCQDFTVALGQRIGNIGMKVSRIPLTRPSCTFRNQTMGSRSQADIMDMMPVSAVVTGLISRKGEIRDFIMMVTGFPQDVAKNIVLVPAEFFRCFCP